MVYLSPFYFPLVCLFISPSVIFLLLISLSAQPDGGEAGDRSRMDEFGFPPPLQHPSTQVFPAVEDWKEALDLHTDTLFPPLSFPLCLHALPWPFCSQRVGSFLSLAHPWPRNEGSHWSSELCLSGYPAFPSDSRAAPLLDILLRHPVQQQQHRGEGRGGATQHRKSQG